MTPSNGSKEPNPTPQELVPEVEEALRDKLPAEFKILSPDVRRRVVADVSSIAIKINHETWDGNFPPPQALQQFEDIHPGLADRIVGMAEKDLDNRHAIDRGVTKYLTRGQWFGFILATIALLGSIFLISIGKGVAGGLIGSAVLIPLVTLFVRGQISSDALQKKEPAEAAKTPPKTGELRNPARPGKPGKRR